MLRRDVALLALGLLIILVGCKPKGFPTVPAQGKVVFTKGGTVKSLHDKEGAVEFESVEQPGLRAYGTIGPDGEFTVMSLKDKAVSPGLVEGTHKVRLNLDEEAAKLVDPRFLHFDKSGITVKAPVEGELVIKVWR